MAKRFSHIFDELDCKKIHLNTNKLDEFLSNTNETTNNSFDEQKFHLELNNEQMLDPMDNVSLETSRKDVVH